MLLSTKDLIFREQPVRKLTKRFVESYTIKEVLSTDTIEIVNTNEDLFSCKCK